MSIEKPTSIKTKRLILRPIVLSDLETIQDYSLDDEWNRILDFHTKESVREFVEKAVNSDWEDNSRFMISYNKNIIGSVGLYINQKEKHAEIGYSLSKKYWGKGIIPEAVNEIFIYGFSELGLDKIFAQTDLMNLPSQSVMKKMNMVQEGIFRKHVIQKNIRRDVVYFSILKTEWEENKLK